MTDLEKLIATLEEIDADFEVEEGGESYTDVVLLSVTTDTASKFVFNDGRYCYTE